MTNPERRVNHKIGNRHANSNHDSAFNLLNLQFVLFVGIEDLT